MRAPSVGVPLRHKCTIPLVLCICADLRSPLARIIYCPRRNSAQKHKPGQPLRKRNKTALYIDDFGAVLVPMLHFVPLRRIASGNQSFVLRTKSVFDWDCTSTAVTRIRAPHSTPTPRWSCFSTRLTRFALLNPRLGGGIVRIARATVLLDRDGCYICGNLRWLRRSRMQWLQVG